MIDLAKLRGINACEDHARYIASAYYAMTQLGVRCDSCLRLIVKDVIRQAADIAYSVFDDLEERYGSDDEKAKIVYEILTDILELAGLKMDEGY